MSGLRAVLFDAVGTLIELSRGVGEIYAEVARCHGVDLPAWRIDDAFARILTRANPMVFPGVPPERAASLERAWWRDVVRDTFRATDQQVRFDDFDACFEELWRRFAGCDVWRARPGACEALRALKGAGLATAVVSNFDQRLPQVLTALGLRSKLDALVLPAQVGAAKPDRRIFEHALAALGAAPEASVYVGDDAVRDLAGARAAGLRAIDARSLATLAALPLRLAEQARENPS